MTKRPTKIQLDKIRSKFSFFNDRLKFNIDITKGDDFDWLRLEIIDTEENKSFTLCAGDYDWIMTPGKIEHHLFGAGKDFAEWGIQKSYDLIKK